MATLTRVKEPVQAEEDLSLGVPAPFPNLERGAQSQTPKITPSLLDTTSLIQHNSYETTSGIKINTHQPTEGSATAAGQLSLTESRNELLPSIIHVEHSCLIILNNLLSSTGPLDSSIITANNQLWSPIVPSRRHSMPASPAEATTEPRSNVSALHTLVNNLRQRDTSTMIEIGSSASKQSEEAGLIKELQARVNSLGEQMLEEDAALAAALVSLLAHLHHLIALNPAPSFLEVIQQDIAPPYHGSGDMYDTLSKQLSDLQAKRLDSGTAPSESRTSNGAGRSVSTSLEQTLLWDQIDRELDIVSTLCRDRMIDPFGDAQELTRIQSPTLPPEYDPADYDITSVDGELPKYDYLRHSLESTSHGQKAGSVMGVSASGTAGGMSEKMRMDLDAVTMAIDRLYMVAPQLHNQRVELKKAKIEQLERAGRANQASTSKISSANSSSAKLASKGATDGSLKGKESDLDHMFGLIGKASSRRLTDQTVFMSDNMKDRMEQARQKDAAKREQFVEQLLNHSTAGRLHAQDAVLQEGPKIRDPEALLSLPEFIREPMPKVQQANMLRNPEQLMTLPEFVRDEQELERLEKLQSKEDSGKSSGTTTPKPPLKQKRSVQNLLKGRSRSMSTTSLWMLGMGKSSSADKESSGTKTQENSKQVSPPLSRAGLDVIYVAEYQENLNNVLVMLRFHRTDISSNIDVEVVPSANSSGRGDRFFVRIGAACSPPLSLPVQVYMGKTVVKAVDEHYEFKLSVPIPSPSGSPQAPSIPTSNNSNAASQPLLDATQLEKLKPTSFVCKSCSLPLVLANKVISYRDLPSEYWSELLDAWMCHQDQKLSERLIQDGAPGGAAFWPKHSEECLVGGSYFLVDEGVMVGNNFRTMEAVKRAEGWKHVKCLCGAVVGRSQVSPLTGTTAFRLAKYSLRPVTPGTEYARIPLSAYVVEDMVEIVQAHATYRFILCDEEEERPRILIWLFKVSSRYSYSTAAHTLQPRPGSMQAAKIMFKIIGPGGTLAPDLKTTIDKHPTFAQAEHLFYPLEACRRLAGSLKESNAVYPPHRRTLNGLDVGWLQRA